MDNFNTTLDNIIALSHNDNDYYNNILRLIENNAISKLITYESINKNLSKDCVRIILLFGKNPTNINDIFIKNNSNDWVLWDEEISHSIFYEAAMAIADSKCVVIDNQFLSINVGKSLVNYITSKSSVILLDKHNDNVGHLNTNIIHTSPKNFIEELIILYN